MALSPGQVAFFVVYAWTVVVYAVAEYLWFTRKPAHDHEGGEDGSKDIEKAPLLGANGGVVVGGPAQQNGSGASANEALDIKPGAVVVPAVRHTGHLASMTNSGMVQVIMFNTGAILKHRLTLRHMSEFGTLMFWYFICDRTSLLPESTKSYNRDTFFFVYLVLTVVAFATSLQTLKAPILLNRQQTEEWKGWMQVLFLLYHYFEAKEIYNAIRVFIAAYVWMTGFGNFSYYYKTNDFGAGRFAQMMWRLNFLVFIACIVLRNSYMLYYICPMHTIYTVFVYAALGILPQLNQNKAWIIAKFVLCFALILVFWNQTVFYTVWKPFSWLVGYLDPRKPQYTDDLYEWFFRSSLDRFIWIYGMVCAFVHPYCQAALTALESLPATKRNTVRSVIIAVTAFCAYLWVEFIYKLPKAEYNEVHPYTSWIPITLFIVARNLTPSLRLHHMRLFGWLGCITLETYISQFHVWLRSDLPDGQPKALLSLIPGYPLLNFALVSALYVLISHRLFELTNSLKNVAVPHDNNQQLMRNVVLLGAAGGLVYFATYGTMSLLLGQ